MLNQKPERKGSDLQPVQRVGVAKWCFIRHDTSMIDEERAILRALALMCVQYIGDGECVDHECISAGEEAIAILVKHGMIEPSGRGGRWTEAGEALMR